MTTPSKKPVFSEEEKDILQEIMNIAFGNATADLAEVIDIYVHLSVPDIKVIRSGALPKYINKTIYKFDQTNIVEQKFWGDFKGSALLVFPQSEESEIIEILSESKDDNITPPHEIHQNDVLMEIGNILIGACVGKVSDLLNTFVTYSPPQVIQDSNNNKKSLLKLIDSDQIAIVMRTVFEFSKQDINGFLLILTNEKSVKWLTKALNDFLDSYE